MSLLYCLTEILHFLKFNIHLPVLGHSCRDAGSLVLDAACRIFSRGMRDHCLQHVGGNLFPNQGLKQCPLHWEHEVIATGQPEKSQTLHFWSPKKIIFPRTKQFSDTTWVSCNLTQFYNCTSDSTG